MFAPRFPKSQNEGWFVILCDEAKDEILGIKRVGWSAGNRGDANKQVQGSTRTTLKFSEEEGGGFKDGRKMEVWVVSDGYTGMIYKIGGIEVPDVPRMSVDDSGKKKETGNEVRIAGIGGSGSG